jgi:hypothetical protein
MGLASAVLGLGKVAIVGSRRVGVPIIPASVHADFMVAPRRLYLEERTGKPPKRERAR